MNQIRIETRISGELIAREVMNTKDTQVREALIRMGWTPPENPTNGARQ